jgi:hypothetical protein
LCGEDVAIVILDRAVEGIDPVPVETVHAPRTGDTVVAVGYGRRGTNGGVGIRERRAAVPIVMVSPREIQLGAGACSGDSGGPALSSQSGAIIGVVSRGGPDCSSTGARNIYSRIDVWGSLVEQGLQLGGGGASMQRTPRHPGAADEAPTDFGAACQSGDDCSSGYCIRRTGTSTMACDSDTPCPSGYYCGAGTGGVRACFHRAS